MKKSKSSNIDSFKYDPKTKTLDIIFHTGAHYRYADVNHLDYHRFETAKSHGTSFASIIKDKYKGILQPKKKD